MSNLKNSLYIMETKSRSKVNNFDSEVILNVEESKVPLHPTIRKSFTRMKNVQKLIEDGKVHISYFGNCDGSPIGGSIRGW
jgi:hypothetical protein